MVIVRCMSSTPSALPNICTISSHLPGTSSIFRSSRRHQHLTTVEPVAGRKFSKEAIAANIYLRQKTHL
jgi:hypothetical protein